MSDVKELFLLLIIKNNEVQFCFYHRIDLCDLETQIRDFAEIKDALGTQFCRYLIALRNWSPSTKLTSS